MVKSGSEKFDKRNVKDRKLFPSRCTPTCFLQVCKDLLSSGCLWVVTWTRQPQIILRIYQKYWDKHVN